MSNQCVSAASPQHCSSPMPTVVAQVANKRVLLPAVVAIPTESGHSEPRKFEALAGTGSPCTMVSRRVVDQIGAGQIGVRQFMPASGVPQTTALYELSIAVPISETGTDESRTLTIARGGTVVFRWASLALKICCVKMVIQG